MTIAAIIFILLISAVSTFGSSIFVEYLLIKHIMDDPVKGLIVSIALGWLLTLLWQAFVFGIDLTGFAINIGGLLGALAIAYPGIRKRRKADQQDSIFE